PCGHKASKRRLARAPLYSLARKKRARATVFCFRTAKPLDGGGGANANPSNLKRQDQAMANASPVSPLAPKTLADLPPIDGVRLAAGAAGIRYQGRTDV